MTEKEIKSRIRQLKRIKLKCRAGSKERIKLHREILKLKEEIDDLYRVNPEKIILIREIEKLEPKISETIDLRKHTEEALQKHIDIVKRKRGIK